MFHAVLGSGVEGQTGSWMFSSIMPKETLNVDYRHMGLARSEDVGGDDNLPCTGS